MPHTKDHRPEWRDRFGRIRCQTCGRNAERFRCTKCGEMADEATVGHGSFGSGTHHPTRKEAS